MKDNRSFKDEAYVAMARFVKALANPTRLEMIDLLRNGEKSVEEIARATGTSVANASQHLQILKKLNLVSNRKEGTYVYYSLARTEVQSLWQLLLKLAYAHVPELQMLMQNKRRGLPRIDEPDPDRFFLLDVRPAEEFRHHHLPGAQNIPFDQLPDRLTEIPRDKPVIAYCRGPFCTWADQAVRILRKHGYEAYRLNQDEGFEG